MSLCKCVDCCKWSFLKIFLFDVFISLSQLYFHYLFAILTKLYGKCSHFILGGHWLGGVMCICFNWISPYILSLHCTSLRIQLWWRALKVSCLDSSRKISFRWVRVSSMQIKTYIILEKLSWTEVPVKIHRWRLMSAIECLQWRREG